MGAGVVELKCPGCGTPVSMGTNECPTCGSPIVISTFNSVFDMELPKVSRYVGNYNKMLSEDPEDREINGAIAMCFLKLKLYDKAIASFEKAIIDNFDNSETYFYAAVSLLRGKRPFVAMRNDIDKVLEYINAANMIEPRGIYYLFDAFVRKDYFERKFLNISPSYVEQLNMVAMYGVSDTDIGILQDLINCDIIL